MSWSGEVTAGSNSTAAELVMRFTTACDTPSLCSSARCTREEQAEQVMPVISSRSRAGSGCTWGAAMSGTRGGVARAGDGRRDLAGAGLRLVERQLGAADPDGVDCHARDGFNGPADCVEAVAAGHAGDMESQGCHGPEYRGRGYTAQEGKMGPGGPGAGAARPISRSRGARTDGS